MNNGISLLLIAICLNTIVAQSIVKISEGFVSGVEIKTRNGRDIFSFEGIPYAEAPIGPLRFSSPVPKKPWSGILQANKANEGCVQPSGDGIKGNEDCLALNVYTPWVSGLENPMLPVMVYIHGGGYTTGIAKRERTGPEYLLDKNVILVTMNYRLGILGFLSTGDLAAPGNFGLKDQLLSLKWVQQNIRAFGGNPNKVTIFGESAGSACIHLHALSEKSKPLYQQYIMQSGTVLYPWAVRTNATYYEVAKKVARLCNCTTANSYSMVDCLRQQSPAQLLSTSSSVFDYLSQLLSIEWGPTVEAESPDAFLTEDPVRLLQKNQMKDGPLIMGDVQDEGLYFVVDLYMNKTLYNVFSNHPETMIRNLLEFYKPALQQNLTDLAMKMKKFYLGDGEPKDKATFLQGYTKFVSDLLFFYPHTQLNRYLQQNERRFYLYVFEFRGTLSRSSLVTKDSTTLGIQHADDLFYLFPISGESLGLPEYITRKPNDYKMVDFMVDLWTSFAGTSIPSVRNPNNPPIWTPSQLDMTNLKIGNYTEPVLTMESTFFPERMKFWFDNVRQYPLQQTIPV